MFYVRLISTSFIISSGQKSSPWLNMVKFDRLKFILEVSEFCTLFCKHTRTHIVDSGHAVSLCPIRNFKHHKIVRCKVLTGVVHNVIFSGFKGFRNFSELFMGSQSRFWHFSNVRNWTKFCTIKVLVNGGQIRLLNF